MNWKEFFRPTKWKIILTIVFIILNAILLFGLSSISCIRSFAYCSKGYVSGFPYGCGACIDNFTIFDYLVAYLLRALSFISFVTFPGLIIFEIINFLLTAFVFLPSFVTFPISIAVIILYHYTIASSIVHLLKNISRKKILVLLGLLIIAAIVLSTILFPLSFTPAGKYPNSLQYQEFKQQCNSLCQDYQSSTNINAAAKYCFTRLNQKLYWGSKAVAIDSEGLPNFKMCDDNVYCFNVIQCNTDNGTLTPSNCTQILCSAYMNVYNDSFKATSKIKELIPSVGNCTLSPNENWFSYYGFVNFSC